MKTEPDPAWMTLLVLLAISVPVGFGINAFIFHEAVFDVHPALHVVVGAVAVGVTTVVAVARSHR